MSFLARKGIPKNRRLSRYQCMLASNDREQFQVVFSDLLASVEFSAEIESRKESCRCKSA